MENHNEKMSDGRTDPAEAMQTQLTKVQLHIENLRALKRNGSGCKN